MFTYFKRRGRSYDVYYKRRWIGVTEPAGSGWIFCDPHTKVVYGFGYTRDSVVSYCFNLGYYVGGKHDSIEFVFAQ